MPTSPCVSCGDPALHTDDDDRPLCALCEEAFTWQRIILDLANGKAEFDLGPWRDENGILDREKFRQAFFPGHEP
jgi:hypothetical protein